ncbi:SPRY_PRY_C-I_1 domain-containing protein isoform X1 [Silurus meridionalis]|uniref:SPRY_PRY_C-I_1 domain-containing protein isoform X1 n=1 Tax=Silurus meridionalis TaxID=175797 RepID=UPI001EE9FA2F|nr:SPRY_PRY_C-I_1 domain-containing protein isoform X1 [Silurus meridionalis]
MTLSATEEISIGAFLSQTSLGNPRKEKKNKRLCRSEPFIKPNLTKFIHQKILYAVANFKNSLKRPKNDPQQLYSSILESIISLTVTESFKQQPPRQKQSVRSENITEERVGSISKKEWKILKNTSANVILDPKTANPSLVLSFDGRSLRTETQREFQSKRNHDEYQKKYKHQYNAWTCVQAKEGYNKGKHYWEVDVKGKNDWRIGVVKESAPRNGFSKLNTATGYWTLRLQFCRLMALTEPVTKLNQAPPSKIGEHLDYEEGKLTFYNAENRKHIYTFKEEFRETVYPVFGTVETEKPLRII